MKGNTAQLQTYISECILWTWYSTHSESSDLSGMNGEVNKQICNRTSKPVLTPRTMVHLPSMPECWRCCDHHCCYYHNHHHTYMRPHCPVTDIKNNIFHLLDIFLSISFLWVGISYTPRDSATTYSAHSSNLCSKLV
jgi:hypothetical protein